LPNNLARATGEYILSALPSVEGMVDFIYHTSAKTILPPNNRGDSFLMVSFWRYTAPIKNYVGSYGFSYHYKNYCKFYDFY
jgi:hypothetical protein